MSQQSDTPETESLSKAERALESISLKYQQLERERDEARLMVSQTNQQLQWDLCICSRCGGEIFHHMDEPFYTCQKCGEWVSLVIYQNYKQLKPSATNSAR